VDAVGGGVEAVLGLDQLAPAAAGGGQPAEEPCVDCLVHPHRVYPDSGEPGAEMAQDLGMLDADFETVDSPELVDALRKLTGRYQRAIDASQQASG
jgi:hypothetical protein